MARVSEELTSTENRIAYARQAYNDSVTEYNTKRELFPTSIVAGMFNFAPASLLESTTSEAQREAPQVKF
jgi:LemA protein